MSPGGAKYGVADLGPPRLDLAGRQLEFTVDQIGLQFGRGQADIERKIRNGSPGSLSIVGMQIQLGPGNSIGVCREEPGGKPAV